MQFFTALIEHFVVGVIALLWIVPFADHIGLLPSLGSLKNNKELAIAAGLPILYVVGMYVDSVASFLFRLAQDQTDRVNKPQRPPGLSYKRTIAILKTAPDEAAKYFLHLISREKIARGVSLCFLLGFIFQALIGSARFPMSPILLLLLFFIGTAIALRFKSLNVTFKRVWLSDASSLSDSTFPVQAATDRQSSSLESCEPPKDP